MNILIIGSGGREHALAWKIKQSPLVQEIYCAPGNGGMSEVAQCFDIKVADRDYLLKFAKDKKVDLTVIGPEVPLADGIVDDFVKNGLKVFGPSKAAAQLEGSKVFSKEFMHKHNIPTAPFQTFGDIMEAKGFLEKVTFPLVIKADGLAAGKGVIICANLEEGQQALDQIMGQKVFQEAGNKVVIEECLQGEEVSILAVSDGNDFIMLDSSQDHKRIFDDDLGPNTGGMGAYSPAPIITDVLRQHIEQSIIDPTIKGMKQEGMPFKGVLYAGLMITSQGPMVLEYNVRFGDPEVQAILPRMKNDIVDIMLASCDGRIKKIKPLWDQRACVCVVMSSGGYPGEYETGMEITGLEQIDEKEVNTIVFHAGTKKEENKIVTSGGRVLGVTSLAHGLDKAVERAYENVEKIKFDHCFFRRDIGAKALAKT